MTDRATVFESTQVGKETTPGTAVPATKQLLSISITPSIQAETDAFIPRGQKYATLVPLGKEWTEADIDGKGVYTDEVYILSSMFGEVTPTTPVGGTLSRLWTWTSDVDGPDDPLTLTIENGSDVRANRFAHGIVTELGMTFNRDEVTVEGKFLGKQLEDGVTKTATPTPIALVPILPKDVSVYVDSLAADLGDTKLTRVVEVELSITDKYGPIWVLDAANDSWASHIEMAPDTEVSLTVASDAEGMQFLETLRSGDSVFMRIEAVGEIIEGSLPYRFRADMALKVTEADDFDDEDGLATVGWKFAIVSDPVWTKAIEISLQNAMTAL